MDVKGFHVYYVGGMMSVWLIMPLSSCCDNYLLVTRSVEPIFSTCLLFLSCPNCYIILSLPITASGVKFYNEKVAKNDTSVAVIILIEYFQLYILIYSLCHGSPEPNLAYSNCTLHCPLYLGTSGWYICIFLFLSIFQ